MRHAMTISESNRDITESDIAATRVAGQDRQYSRYPLWDPSVADVIRRAQHDRAVVIKAWLCRFVSGIWNRRNPR